MSASSVLQGIVNSYMSLSRTDTSKLTKDMSLALNDQEKAYMPIVQKVQKIVFCAEKTVTPHISVFFLAENGAEYCWDLSVKIRNKWNVDSSEPVQKYDFFGSLTVMKIPEEVTEIYSGKGKRMQWQLDS